jgi:hypothetical protein
MRLRLVACSSTSLGGSIATIVIYGYCLLQGANYLSDGSEMLLEVLDPGLIGGALRVIHDYCCCADCNVSELYADGLQPTAVVSDRLCRLAQPAAQVLHRCWATGPS